MPQDFQFFLFLDIFLLLVPVEIVSHYPDIDSSHWLREDVQWIIDKGFRENFTV